MMLNGTVVCKNLIKKINTYLELCAFFFYMQNLKEKHA